MAVGLIYDDIYLEHDTGLHPENSDRLRDIMMVLEESGVKAQLTAILPREATFEELGQVHSPMYISSVKARAKLGGGWLDADTPISPASYRVALYAAGGGMRAVEAVMGGEVATAFALVRPPGHHATRDHAMGFCLFNNIAITARRALEKYSLKRILIVDFDVHHGNGTQDTFYADPRVLYFSTHQSPFYPGSGEVAEIGRDEGKGFTVNVPLPGGCGDEEYLRVYNEILVPLALTFNPQLVLVSAGYDAHWKDTISAMQLTTTGYAQLVHILQDVVEETCGGKLVFVLEGGYHLDGLQESVKAVLKELKGESILGEEELNVEETRSTFTDSIVDRVANTHKDSWEFTMA